MRGPLWRIDHSRLRLLDTLSTVLDLEDPAGSGERNVTAFGLVSFRDFHEPFLNELRRSRHGIRIDLDVWKQICVPPFVDFRGRATQLNAHPTFHQVSDELLVGI